MHDSSWIRENSDCIEFAFVGRKTNPKFRASFFPSGDGYKRCINGWGEREGVRPRYWPAAARLFRARQRSLFPLDFRRKSIRFRRLSRRPSRSSPSTPSKGVYLPLSPPRSLSTTGRSSPRTLDAVPRGFGARYNTGET